MVLGGQTLDDYFKTWGQADSGKDKEMANLLSKKAKEENRKIEVKWNGDHYITFYPDGSLSRIEHEGQENEFKKYEEVATYGYTIGNDGKEKIIR